MGIQHQGTTNLQELMGNFNVSCLKTCSPGDLPAEIRLSAALLCTLNQTDSAQNEQDRRNEEQMVRKHNWTQHKRFSKVISLKAKNSESVLLAEPHVSVMFSCQTLTLSAGVSCRTLQIAESKTLKLEKDYLAEPWNAASFRKCPNG